jgi:hypothetical protein
MAEAVMMFINEDVLRGLDEQVETTAKMTNIISHLILIRASVGYTWCSKPYVRKFPRGVKIAKCCNVYECD